MITAALLACAVGVHPLTMSKVIDVESGRVPHALNVNKLRGPQPRPTSAQEAADLAHRYIALGHSVDLGLAQINSRNLAALGVTVEQMLHDPCANLAAGARILSAGYARAAAAHGPGQGALQAALSAYNTGSLTRGFGNGYVAKYFRPGPPVPALVETDAASRPPSLQGTPPAPAGPNRGPTKLAPHAADTTVFIREASHVVVD